MVSFNIKALNQARSEIVLTVGTSILVISPIGVPLQASTMLPPNIRNQLPFAFYPLINITRHCSVDHLTSETLSSVLNV